MARKKINLNTANVASADQPAVRSVYEICGIATTTFKHKTLAEYSAALNGMSLIELHEEAFKQGVPTNPHRPLQISKLEERFIREHGKFRTPINQPVDSARDADPELRAQAEKILARGR